MSVRILIGDMRQRLRDLPDASVDSVVCDPPYHLTSIVKRFGKPNSAPINNRDEKEGRNGPYHRTSKGFMGQTWDGGDVAFDPDTWAEVLRVLKPGGHMVAFSGTRTYHRMAVAIEDAGFEVRDQLAWVYGSGFPKSLDVSKAIDKAAGVAFSAEPASGVGFMGPDGPGGYNITKNKLTRAGDSTPEAVAWQGWGTALKPSWEPICLARKPLDGTVAQNVLAHGTGALNIAACRISADDPDREQPTSQGGDRNSPDGSMGGTSGERVVCLRCHSDDTGILASFGLERGGRSDLPANGSEHAPGDPQSPGSQDDCPTCRDCGDELVRVPQEGAQASLLQRPDADSVRAPDAAGGHSRDGLSKASSDDTAQDIKRQYIPNGKNKVYGENMGGGDWSLAPEGRWPANLCHDGSDEVLAGFPDELRARGNIGPSKGGGGMYGHGDCSNDFGAGDSGSAARFFYCAKADTAERTNGLDGCETVSIVGSWEGADLNLKLLVDTAPSPPKVIAVSGTPASSASEWSMFWFGSERTAPSLAECRFITKTAKNSTTASRTWSYLAGLITRESTAVARLETANGGNLAANAESSTQSVTIISGETESLPGVGPVPSGTPLRISVSEGWPGHPTVKPVALMRWLCRLVTPKGGTVLDPFMGSGSTGIAADAEQFNFIGCEMSPEYAAIAERRMKDAAGMFADVQAIEAQRAETTEIGSVGDESAVAKPCTQKRAA